MRVIIGATGNGFPIHPIGWIEVEEENLSENVSQRLIALGVSQEDDHLLIYKPMTMESSVIDFTVPDSEKDLEELAEIKSPDQLEELIDELF